MACWVHSTKRVRGQRGSIPRPATVAFASQRVDRESPGLRFFVRDNEEYVGMARLVERAVAREISSVELSLDVIDTDRQPTGEEVLAVPTDRLCPPERQRVRVAPPGRPCDDDNSA